MDQMVPINLEIDFGKIIATTLKHGASWSCPQINPCMRVPIVQNAQQIVLDTELHLLTGVMA